MAFNTNDLINKYKQALASPVGQTLSSFTKTIPTYQFGEKVGKLVSNAVDLRNNQRTSKTLMEQAQLNQKAVAKAKSPQLAQQLRQRAGQQFQQVSQQTTPLVQQAKINYQQAKGALLPTMARTALTLSGANKVGMFGSALGGALGAGISKVMGGNVYEGLGSGLAKGIEYSGLNKYTNPVIAGITGKVLQNATPIVQQIFGRSMTGIANILENEISAQLEGVSQSGGEKILAFTLGSVFGKGGSKQDWDKLVETMTINKEISNRAALQLRGKWGRWVEMAKDKLDTMKVIDPDPKIGARDHMITMQEYLKKYGQSGAIDLSAKVGGKADVTKGRLTYEGKAKENLPYVAGLIDGEGHIRLTPAKNGQGRSYHRPDIIVAQKDRKILDELMSLYGGRIDKQVRPNWDKTGTSEMHYWRLSGRKAVELAKEIAPMLRVKSEQAKRLTALNYDEAGRMIKSTIPDLSVVQPSRLQKAQPSSGGEIGGVTSPTSRQSTTQGLPPSQINKEPLDLPSSPIISRGGTGYIPEEKIQSFEQKTASAEVASSQRSLYSPDDFTLFNRIKKMATSKEFQEGDIETLRKKNMKVVEQALERVREAEPNITDDVEALDYILNLPTGNEARMPGIPRESFGQGDNVYNAEATPVTVKKIQVRTEEARAREAKAEFDAWQKSYRDQTKPASTATQSTGVANQIKGATKSPTARNPEELKDISGFHAGFRDLYRNFKAVYGKRYEEVKRVVLDPFDKSKGAFVDMQKQIVEDLDTNVVKKLGIQKGSKESKLVQLYGEKKITLDELKKTKNWEKIVEADAWFRNKYDTLLDEVNAVRARIYPNDPTKIIPKRSDYYRHFREMSQGFRGLLNIFDTPAGISSNLSGVSEFTKPKSKFLSFAQQRLGGESDIDAVGGFIDYAKTAAYAKHIDPNTARFRALSEELAAETADGSPNAGKLNNFVEYLQDVANDLSGKTNPMDRTAQKWVPGGRKTFQVLSWLNSRIKANAVVGNLSSTVAQIFNVPQGIVSAGPLNAVKGLKKTLAGIFTPNSPLQKSNFIKERYASTLYNRFDKGILQNSKKFASWMTGVLDEVGTKYIWNAHYEKALSQGTQDAVGYADDITRSLVAGRGIGEVPLAQKSKIFQMIAPFQLEVGNLWHVMGDMVGEKKFGSVAALFLANYLFNRGAEAIRGSDVTFDPIQATIEGLKAYEEEDDKKMGTLKFGGRLAGEVLSNLPVGQYAAAAYPEYGMKVGDTQLPTRKDLFGKGDATRFGVGPILVKAISEPQYNILPAFGGAQFKKTIEGKMSYDKGYSESKTGRVRFPIESNTPNAIKSSLFGQYASPEAREYFDKNRTVLGEKQSETFKAMNEADRKEYIQSIYENREQNKKKEKEESSGLIDKVEAAGLETTTREADKFPFPDYSKSAPSQTLRADLNFNGKGKADIVFHFKDAKGKVTSVPQSEEEFTGGKQEYGLEMQIPKDASIGNGQVWVTVNGKEVSGTRKAHAIVNTQPLNRYDRNAQNQMNYTQRNETFTSENKEKVNDPITDAKVNVLKEKVRLQGGVQQEGNTIAYKDGNTVKTIDTSFEPVKPKLTGSAELDKKLISKYNGQVTQKVNDIVELYEIGKISSEEAEKAIKAIKTKSISGAKKAKKGRKPSFKIARVKIPKLKLAKVKKIKIPRPKKTKAYRLKLPKIKKLKVTGRLSV